MIARVLVNSPLQVISAWEFQRFLPNALGREVSEFDLILVDVGSVRSVEQTHETAARLGLTFRSLGRRGHSPDRVRRRFAKVRREVAGLDAEDVVAVGDPSFDLYRDAVARSRPAQAWALDDGVGNWRYLNAVVSKQCFPQLFQVGALRKLAKGLVVGRTRTPRWEDLHWFSLFARYLADHDRIHQNSLARLKARSSLTTDDDGRVLFLGSPLVSVGVLSKTDYVALCRSAADRLADRYPGARLTYVRHRAEGSAEHGVDFFDDIEDSAGPIELRWLDGSRPPRAVVGVFSTALFTLAELLRGRSDVVSLWPGDGFELMARRDQLVELFSLFEASHAEGSIRLEMIQS